MPGLEPSVGMAIPHKVENTEYVKAGPVIIGVEYRFFPVGMQLAEYKSRDFRPEDVPKESDLVDEEGVSIHVFEDRDGKLLEHLRFDCFRHQPHYHYIHQAEQREECGYIDAVANGDAFSWSMERLRTRLPHMLTEAGAAELAQRVREDCDIEAALVKVAAAGYIAISRLSSTAKHR